MQFSRQQRRTFMALACKIAWADGVVTSEETTFVHGLMQRFANFAIDEEELNQWLTQGVPPAELSLLPNGLGQLFFYEAMRLAEVDGDLSDREVALLERIMQRVFEPRPQGTTLARVALEKRARPK